MIALGKIDFDFASIELLDNGVCRLVFFDEIQLKEEYVRKIHESMISLFNGKKYPILIQTGRNSLATYGAREYSARKMNDIRLAEAYVCQTVYHRILVNLYYTLNRPSTPLRIFSNEDEATKWLLTFLD